jgi:hypothetical protein
MTTGTSRIFDQRSLHAAEWTARLVIGLRALRLMVRASGPASTLPSLDAPPEARALPAAR